MAQRIPLPLTVSCFSIIQIGFTFLVLVHPGSPGQRAVKRVCVCVCVCVCAVRVAPSVLWPVYADVFEHPPPRLASRRPVWSDMTSVDTVTQWREDWSSASVVYRQAGFHLPRHTWDSDEPFPDRSLGATWRIQLNDCGRRLCGLMPNYLDQLFLLSGISDFSGLCVSNGFTYRFTII